MYHSNFPSMVVNFAKAGVIPDSLSSLSDVDLRALSKEVGRFGREAGPALEIIKAEAASRGLQLEDDMPKGRWLNQIGRKAPETLPSPTTVNRNAPTTPRWPATTSFRSPHDGKAP